MNEHFKEFREAVLAGKLQTLQGLAKIETVINSRGIFHRGICGRWTTALIFSVQQNMMDIFKFLLQVPGIDVNLVDPNCERTALHWAVFNSNEEMVKILVNIPNIKFEMKDFDGKTAQNMADAKVACIMLTAINDQLRAKLEENKIGSTNAEEEIKEIQFYGKRKLKSTLEALELKKNNHQEELFKLDRVIDEVKKCLNNVDPGETLEDEEPFQRVGKVERSGNQNACEEREKLQAKARSLNCKYEKDKKLAKEYNVRSDKMKERKTFNIGGQVSINKRAQNNDKKYKGNTRDIKNKFPKEMKDGTKPLRAKSSRRGNRNLGSMKTRWRSDRAYDFSRNHMEINDTETPNDELDLSQII